MEDRTRHKYKVLLVHNFLTPYRIPLFAALGNHFDLDVWLLGNVRHIREWKVEEAVSTCRFHFLPHISVYLGSRDYRLLINPTLPLRLWGKKWDAVIVCGWDTPAAFQVARWAHRKKIPLVLWSGSTAGESNWRRQVFSGLVRRHVRLADAWIAYGTRAKEYLVSLGAVPERIFKAFNTVDSCHFARQAEQCRHNLDKLKKKYVVRTSHVLFYCGQLIDRKGLADFLPAFGRAVADGLDAELFVAGTGKRRAVLEAQARNCAPERVRFLGFVPREELPGLYALSDLFVLPSREEVWGLVINEALSCGVPVLTTSAVGASEDIIRHGENGYVVPPGDTEAMYTMLTYHFTLSRSRQHVMRNQARQSMQFFTIDAAANRFVDAVNCAIASGSSTV